MRRCAIPQLIEPAVEVVNLDHAFSIQLLPCLPRCGPDAAIQQGRYNVARACRKRPQARPNNTERRDNFPPATERAKTEVICAFKHRSYSRWGHGVNHRKPQLLHIIEHRILKHQGRTEIAMLAIDGKKTDAAHKLDCFADLHSARDGTHHPNDTSSWSVYE